LEHYLTLVPAEGFQMPVLRQAAAVNRHFAFLPEKVCQRFFCAKKAKTRNAFNIGLAKNRRTEFLSAFVLLFCFSSGRRNNFQPVKEASTLEH